MVFKVRLLFHKPICTLLLMLLRYLRKIIRKSISGQPVGFTDFFGYLVGEQLLKGVIDKSAKVTNDI